jgi:2-(1,2-epoxy-1,2-dihydrophenyl)acetyl-CoA isomerase
MEYKAVILEIFQETIAVLRLNRPSSLNSFNIDVMSGITEACSAISKNHKIRALVITGEGA